jgi:hypothetical protein
VTLALLVIAALGAVAPCVVLWASDQRRRSEAA